MNDMQRTARERKGGANDPISIRDIVLFLAISFAFAVLISVSPASADPGNSTTYRLAVQTDSLNDVGNSSTYRFAADSGPGIGNSSSYRAYLGFASFGARFEQASYPPLVNFTSLVGESFVYQSTTARFQISVKNSGNVNSEIIPRLYIYNSAGSLVFQRTGTATTLEAGATVSLLQYSTLVFSVSTIATGTYNATVNILYTDANNNTNVTQNRSVLFEIRAVSTTDITTTTTGGGYVAPATYVGPAKSTELPVEFVSAPVLARVTKGDVYEDVASLINPTGKKKRVTLSVKGVPEGWVLLGFSTIDLEPYGEAGIPIAVSLPDDAPSGTYIVEIEASDGTASATASSFIVRVAEPVKLSSPSGESMPEDLHVNRFAHVDTQKKETKFTLKIKSEADTKRLSFVENIDKSIAATADDIVFIDKPHAILQRDPKIQWLFENITKGEEKSVSYYVNKVVNDTDPLLYPSIEDITVLTGQVLLQQLPVLPPSFAFNIDYTALNIFALLALAMLGIIITYRLEHRIRRKTYLHGLRQFIGKPILTAETGRKIGIVDDITFMPSTGELLNVVVKKPTPYAQRLLVRRGAKNRLYVPFQSVKGAGDYIVITEKDIVFEAMLRRRPQGMKAVWMANQARDPFRFYKTSGKIKFSQLQQTQEQKQVQQTLQQYIGPYKGYLPSTARKPDSVRAHLHELKRLYKDGIIDEMTYRATKKRLLEGSNIVHDGRESITDRLKKKIRVL